MADRVHWAADTHPSTAAGLRRELFSAVLVYFGPVGDRQSTRVEAEVLRRLAAGVDLRAGGAGGGADLRRSAGHDGALPVGWAQLARCQEGRDGALAQPGTLEHAREAALQRIGARLEQGRGPAVKRVQRLEPGFIRAGGLRAPAARG